MSCADRDVSKGLRTAWINAERDRRIRFRKERPLRSCLAGYPTRIFWSGSVVFVPKRQRGCVKSAERRKHFPFAPFEHRMVFRDFLPFLPTTRGDSRATQPLPFSTIAKALVCVMLGVVCNNGRTGTAISFLVYESFGAFREAFFLHLEWTKR